ncbi:MAG: hypothetical protein J5792_01630, partial [Bacteroidales bacterium]|nr:hypothetical protein [Bacteroidales bacterium]
MKKTIFLILCALCVVVTAVAQPVVPPTQHITYSPRYSYMRPIQIIDSVYAGDYYSSMVSLSYTILYNGVPIDSMHKFGTVTLTMRSQGNNYQVNSFVTGSINLPQDVSLMGMNASSFSLGIINTTVACNRNRPILLDMRLEKLGKYSVILEILNQNNTTKQNIGTSCCNFSPDYYATNGKKGSVWISDTISFELQPDTVYTYLKIDSACSYKWRDSIYQVSGVYRWDYADSIGNDSIVFLYLDAGNYSFHTKETVHICEGSSYLFKNRYLTQSGSYYDTLQSRYGCDSIHQLDLEVHPHLLFGDTIQTCFGEPVVWHGKKLSQPGVYYDSLKSVYGCDSVHFVLLQVRPVYSDTGREFVCEGSSIVWHGKKLSAEGLYVDSLKSRYGCDSVCLLNLIICPTYLFVDSFFICDNQSYLWRGRQLRHSGIYYDSLHSRYGCDSVYMLRLQVYPAYYHADSFAICDNGFYLWRGRQLRQSGTYYDSLHSRYGCDSVYMFRLQVHPTYYHVDSAAICDNGFYLWRGRFLRQSGTYYDSLHSRHGCDSVYMLRLQVHPTYYHADSAAICDNGFFLWRGRQLRQSGIYYDSLQSR